MTFTSKLRFTIWRASSRPESAPAPMACTPTLPAAVASDGLATTVRFVASRTVKKPVVFQIEAIVAECPEII